MSFFNTGKILVNIRPGMGGCDLLWIEAVGILFGLLCRHTVWSVMHLARQQSKDYQLAVRPD